MNMNTGGWASRVLMPLLRIVRSSPNAMVPVVVISEPVNSETAALVNADIAIVAKGTGATLAQVPDGTTAGGNKRGTYATDLQKSRSAASYVASGGYSFIGSGKDNTSSNWNTFVGAGSGNVASGDTSAVVGGLQNVASANYSGIVSGAFNIASGQQSAVVGGNSNTASSTYSFVGGGQSNLASTSTHATVCGGNNNVANGQSAFVGGGASNVSSQQYSVIGGGQNNTTSALWGFIGGGFNSITSGDYSAIVGGYQNSAAGDYSFVSGGRRGTTRSIAGYHVFPACTIPISDAYGVTQSALLLLGRQTTDATPTVLTSNTSAAGTTNQVILPNNSAYSFSGEVIAGRTGAGDTARWTINGAIKRGASAATTAMVGTPTVTMTHNDAGASGWIVNVTADTTNGGIKVEVTGAASTTIRWVCKINTTEMTF